MNFPYEDIVSLPHPVSPRHARMPDKDRAAQFSPFAALSGHEAAIHETARLTDMRIELDEDEKARLNEQLQEVARRLKDRPTVSITCFVRDERKPGGAYVTLTGVVKKIDTVMQAVVLDSGQQVAVEDVYDIQISV